MKNNVKVLVAGLWILVATVCALEAKAAAPNTMRLTLKAPIQTWDEGIPLGNGILGGLLWGEGNTINLSLDRGDLWDERLPAEYLKPDWTYETLCKLKAAGRQKEIVRRFDAPYHMPYPTKLPVGRLVLTLDPSLQAESFTLEMAQALGRITFKTKDTPPASPVLECFFSANREVALLRVPGKTLKLKFIRPHGLDRLGYEPAEFGQETNMQWMVQKAALGLSYAVVVASKPDGQGRTLVAVTIQSNAKGKSPLAEGKRLVTAALADGFDNIFETHCAWWKSFWEISSVTIPDERLQRHYNLVKYFYGAASRPDAPPIPLQGLWTRDDGNLPPWKGDYHNDLNTEMTYLPYHVAGLTAQGESFINFNWNLLPQYRRFARTFYGLKKGAAVPGVSTLAGKPTGGWSQYSLSPTNGLWVGLTFYLHWRYTMDKQFLKERAYPWLSEVATGIVGLLHEKNGKLYLPLSSSPEIYNNSLRAWLEPNSNYDLALMQWAFEALAEMADALGKKQDARHWRELRAKLDPLWVDKDNVLMFAKGEPFNASHRHHSHAMAIHPLGRVNVEQGERARRIINATLDRMIAKGTRAWCGYSFSWFASMLARCGRPEQALDYLQKYEAAFTLRNGFHANGDQLKIGLSWFTYRPFTLEGNFLAMDAIHEMLLQSWAPNPEKDPTPVLRIFPAVPWRWHNVSFENLRAEGGFHVSARRRNNATEWFRVTATVDGLLRIKDTFGQAVPVFSRKDVQKKNGHYEVFLKAGESVEASLPVPGEIPPPPKNVTRPFQPMYCVAKENFTRLSLNSYLREGSLYTYPVRDLPATKEVPARSPLRTVVFDPQKVVFGFHGLSPKSHYRIRAVFLSESGQRAVRVLAGRTVLESNLKLPDKHPIVREWTVPAEAYAQGDLLFIIERVSGPNAVISQLEVFSDNPTKLQPIPISKEEIHPPYFTLLPVSVPGIESVKQSLNGTWFFNPAPEQGFQKFRPTAQNSSTTNAPTNSTSEPSQAAKKKTTSKWTNIRVPGEWVMQGFTVPAGQAAGYRRTFEIPESWSGKRIKLRCNGVYSLCTVWVNGIKVGGHEGGFTPFELDVTKAVHPGVNTIALTVKNESLADRLASGSMYAVHPLGGINRSIYLFAVPPVHIRKIHITTDFDRSFRNATLKTEITVANESDSKAETVQCELSLEPWRKGSKEDSSNAKDLGTVSFSPLAPGGTSAVKQTSQIQKPRKWDPEHPNLYVLTAKLLVNGKPVEVVKQRFGFRKVEVRGNQLFVNGRPVKLHGVCRHEVHPLFGRSLPPELKLRWKDADIFRKGNCNFIRTSHYPPDEEFLNACDELGLFVEEEAPFCWARPTGTTARRLVIRETLEMVERDWNHPCVIFWSLANESRWTTAFLASSKAVRSVDPTRPQIFCYGQVDLASSHYPGPDGPARVAKSPLPVIFDEYCHLNTYNRYEWLTDPGLRDVWGKVLLPMWERMRQSKGCLGGSLWAAIDDSFAMPNGTWVGYGTWGPVDGWRRQKPEYWHMKKIYSPVRVQPRTIPKPVNGKPIRLTIENRFLFTNLNECKLEWRLDGSEKTKQLKTATLPSVPPGKTGTVELPVEVTGADAFLYLRFIGPRGFVVDEYRLPIGKEETSSQNQKASGTADKEAAKAEKTSQNHPVVLRETETAWEITSGSFTYKVSKTDGQISCPGRIIGGPHLMLLPLNGDNGGNVQIKGNSTKIKPYTDTCSHWNCEKVEARQKRQAVQVKISGRYEEADGTFTLLFEPDGTLQVSYAFTCRKAVNPRQIGIVLDLPKTCDTLAWRRQGLWTIYPPDHIGRLKGKARAFDMHACGLFGPRVKPNWPWSKDGNELGSNDFRSTKANILEASLTSSDGKGIRVISDGTQHVRAWVDGSRIRLLVADYSNIGAEPFLARHTQHKLNPYRPKDYGNIIGKETFFKWHAQLKHKPLKVGAKVKGTTRLELK